MSTQEEKRFKQWAAALAVHDSTRERKPEGYRELYQPAEPWRKQRRFFDSIKRVALGCKFNVRELSESMRDTSYTEAKDMCKSLMAKYLVTLDGDNGELL